MSLLAFSFLILAVEPNEVDSRLYEADKVRSSDNAKFSDVLASLTPHFDSFTINQKYYYLYLSGYESAYKGDMRKAISLYEHVKQNSQDVTLRYRASISLVNLYALKKDWQSGFEFLDLISNSYEKVSDIDIRHQGLVVAAVFYNELEEYEMSQIYVERLLKEQVSGRNLCMTLSLKLKADLSTSKFVELEKNLLDAINTCNNAKELLVVNILRTYLASYYLTQEESGKVISLLEKHYEEIIQSNYQYLKIETNNLLAQAYLKLNDNPSAKKHALIIVKSEQVNEYLEAAVNAYKVLSVVSRQSKDYQSAFDFHDKYIESKESLFEQVKAKQLAVESAKHKAREKDNQIILLNKQNEILQLEKVLSEETATFNRWLIILLILVATILVLWLFYVKRSQQRLRFLAEYDSLTKISNRAHFTQNAEDILVYYRNNERTASLILFDLDNFKKINDTNGHLVGDEVLRLTAEACKSCVRKVDVFGRVGGEEFAILLPGCEHEQALKIAEDCRQKVSEIDTTKIGHEFDISASFGVTDTGASGYELKDLLANADEAMYLAKRRGRNRVVQHTKD